MSTTLKFQVAPRIGPAMPRGARVAAAAAAALLAALTSIGDARRRPRATPPRQPRSPAEEAQAVRELAQQYRLSDPRFADDLMAAADRHERQPGA
jgi:hypothetical protein